MVMWTSEYICSHSAEALKAQRMCCRIAVLFESTEVGALESQILLEGIGRLMCSGTASRSLPDRLSDTRNHRVLSRGTSPARPFRRHRE
jgi:hypothetical protein